jgi:hypothetical protein
VKWILANNGDCDHEETTYPEFALYGPSWRITATAYKPTDGCSSLSHIHIPTDVEILPLKFAYRCRRFDAVAFERESRIHVIGEEAFAESGIERLVIPRSVERFEASDFSRCSKLVNFEFELNSALDDLGKSVSAGCALEILCLPATSPSISFGNWRFLLCLTFFSPEFGFTVIEGSLEFATGINVNMPSHFETIWRRTCVICLAT